MIREGMQSEKKMENIRSKRETGADVGKVVAAAVGRLRVHFIGEEEHCLRAMDTALATLVFQ